MTRRGIYVSSKSMYGPMWKKYRAEGVKLDGQPEPLRLNIISSWIDECEFGQTKSWHDRWLQNIHEVTQAKSLVLYLPDSFLLSSNPDDHPKGGCFVELGAALANNTSVFAVSADYLSFFHHPLVVRCCTIELALRAAANLDLPF